MWLVVFGCFGIGAAGVWHSGGSKTVTVVGLKAKGDGEESDCDSHDISILARLQGPEALAEVILDVNANFRAYGT